MTPELEGLSRTYPCTQWQGETEKPSQIDCPPAIEYPPIPSPVEILFVSYNPPKEDAHFWKGPSDNLRQHLRWVISSWWGQTFTSDLEFLDIFLRRGCYLVQAVKCWFSSGEPSPGAIRKCAGNLAADVGDLRPCAICLLGTVPCEAAKIKALPELRMPLWLRCSRRHKGPDDDWPCGERQEVKGTKVVTTVLPHHYDRCHTLAALRQLLVPPKDAARYPARTSELVRTWLERQLAAP